MPYVLYPHVDFIRIDQGVDLLLEKMPDFEVRHGAARIELGQLSLPHFDTVTLVLLAGPLDKNGNGHVIGLASAKRFHAHSSDEPDSRSYPIEQLDGAKVSEYSTVTLSNGTVMYDVRLDKYDMPSDLTNGERLALAYALSWHENCAVPEFDLPYHQTMERLANIRIPALTTLTAHVEIIRTRHPELQPVSAEVFRTAFWKTRLRRPLDRR